MIRLLESGSAASTTIVRLEGEVSFEPGVVRWALAGEAGSLEGTWRQESPDRVELAFANPEAPDAVAMRRTLERVASSGDPFRGVWRYRDRALGVYVYERYANDGVYEFRIPTSPGGNSGSWTRDGRSVVLTWEEGRSVSYTLASAGTSLRLEPTGDSAALRYVGAELWYPMYR